MQLWVYTSQLNQWIWGKKASQALLAPVAKGIFGAGGNSGAGNWGCSLCGTGSRAVYSKAAPCSWLRFVSQKLKN